MATATQPSLGGNSLPMPDSQTYEILYRGGTQEMADGSIVHDLVDGTGRYLFHLTWLLLNATELSTLKTAFASIKNATATYVSIENSSHTVTRVNDGRMNVTPRVTAQGEIAFDVSFDLIEDS